MVLRRPDDRSYRTDDNLRFIDVDFMPIFCERCGRNPPSFFHQEYGSRRQGAAREYCFESQPVKSPWARLESECRAVLVHQPFVPKARVAVVQPGDDFESRHVEAASIIGGHNSIQVGSKFLVEIEIRNGAPMSKIGEDRRTDLSRSPHSVMQGARRIGSILLSGCVDGASK